MDLENSLDLGRFFEEIDVEFIRGEAARFDAGTRAGSWRMNHSMVMDVVDGWFNDVGGRMHRWTIQRRWPEPLSRLAIVFLWRHCQEALGDLPGSQVAEALAWEENAALWEQAVIESHLGPCHQPASRISPRL